MTTNEAKLIEMLESDDFRIRREAISSDKVTEKVLMMALDRLGDDNTLADLIFNHRKITEAVLFRALDHSEFNVRWSASRSFRATEEFLLRVMELRDDAEMDFYLRENAVKNPRATNAVLLEGLTDDLDEIRNIACAKLATRVVLYSDKDIAEAWVFVRFEEELGRAVFKRESERLLDSEQYIYLSHHDLHQVISKEYMFITAWVSRKTCLSAVEFSDDARA